MILSVEMLWNFLCWPLLMKWNAAMLIKMNRMQINVPGIIISRRQNYSIKIIFSRSKCVFWRRSWSNYGFNSLNAWENVFRGMWHFFLTNEAKWSIWDLPTFRSQRHLSNQSNQIRLHVFQWKSFLSHRPHEKKLSQSERRSVISSRRLYNLWASSLFFYD